MILEDRTRIVERFLKRESQADLAREYGCSREAIRLIVTRYLGKEGVKKLYENWELDDLNLLYSLLQEDSLKTLEELEAQTGIGIGRIKNLFRKYKIQRDRNKILSKTITEGKAQGRSPLTKEYLKKKYLDENMTAKEIARETGYDLVTINKYIQHHRLLKRPYASNVKA